MESAFERVHPNTPTGVKAMLSDIFDYDLTDAVYYRDPEVESVWKVVLKSGINVIAYMAGYPDAWGRIQERNDAEDDNW